MSSSLKSYLLSVAGWILADALFISIRFVGLSSVPAFDSLDYSSFDHTLFYTRSLLFGFLIGSAFYASNGLLDRPYLRRRPYWVLITVNILVCLLFVSMLLIIQQYRIIIINNNEVSFSEFRDRLISVNFIVILGYNTIVSFIFVMVRQIDRKFGPGNLLKLLMGAFYHPRSIERIFMFLDLKDSTTHAERLGNIKFGSLIQDCFKDMSVVIDHKAQFYQYVGDEAILYWEVEDGAEQANCLRAYFAFMKVILENKDHYQRNYGIVPEFKAGVHIGQATVIEVGEVKREIAYLGDVMNTAARIQGKCNEYGQNFLVSGSLLSRLAAVPSHFDIVSVGHTELRGRSDTVELFSVRERLVS